MLETQFVSMIESPYVVKIIEEIIMVDEKSGELLSYVCI